MILCVGVMQYTVTNTKTVVAFGFGRLTAFGALVFNYEDMCSVKCI
jgi:hypothetical protein